MSEAGILARGKFNYEAHRDLNNSETLAYIETLTKEKPKEKPKEVFKEIKKEKKKNAESTK